MSKTDIAIYNSLFRKINLKEHLVYIPDYLQPLTFMALETDTKLKEVLMTLGYVGTDIDLKTFKDFFESHTKMELVETKFEEDEFGEVSSVYHRYEDKKFISESTLKQKLKILKLIGLVELDSKKIKLTTQGLSFYHGKYTERNGRATPAAKLERVTKAKLLAFSNSYIPVTNEKVWEDQNIYKYNTFDFVVLQSNVNETLRHYKDKLTKIRNYVNSCVKSTLADATVDYLRDTKFDTNFEPLTLDTETSDIFIEQNIYEKYKDEIDGIFSDETLVQESGYLIVAKCKISFNIKTFE